MQSQTSIYTVHIDTTCKPKERGPLFSFKRTVERVGRCFRRKIRSVEGQQTSRHFACPARMDESGCIPLLGQKISTATAIPGCWNRRTFHHPHPVFEDCCTQPPSVALNLVHNYRHRLPAQWYHVSLSEWAQRVALQSRNIKDHSVGRNVS